MDNEKTPEEIRLANATQGIADAAAERVAAVHAARRAGLPWWRIAAALGLSERAAHYVIKPPQR